MKRILCAALIGNFACTELNVLDQSDPQTPLPFAELARRWSDKDIDGTTQLVEGRLRLRTTIAAASVDCDPEESSAVACADLDADGLSDMWEHVALQRLRPFVRMHAEEPLFRDFQGRVASIGRVTPAANGHIRVFLPIVFSYDYGRCSATEHRGDPERVVLDLVQRDRRTVEVAGAYTASHEGTGLDGSLRIHGEAMDELEYVMDSKTQMLRWVVYSSIGKHAIYPSAHACSEKGRFPCTGDDCASDGDGRNDLLPSVYNAGEPGRANLDIAVPQDGAPTLLLEQVWSEQNYCGDVPNTANYSINCGGPIRVKLIDDPFAL